MSNTGSYLVLMGREWGWEIFKAIEKHAYLKPGKVTGTPRGFASIANVDEVPVKHLDRLESFFMVSFDVLTSAGRDT